MWGMTLKVFREEGGVRALYRGLVPTAMGVAPYVGEFEFPVGCPFPISFSFYFINSRPLFEFWFFGHLHLWELWESTDELNLF